MKKYLHIPTLTVMLISAAISGIFSKALISELNLNFFITFIISTIILFTIKKLDSYFLKDRSFFKVLLLNIEESERIYTQRNYKYNIKS
ncbi:hypothetical protein [Acinetobacter pittii]|uniref:hypothetical protein n=1 Tax=Acinetobacter pittii TaxID=48296 RepID=UPI002DBAC0EC|nr:hypothetical protein [Acinetobacter pittii]MEB6671162.1 hypothetical protein [Acinetobacter pittii]